MGFWVTDEEKQALHEGCNIIFSALYKCLKRLKKTRLYISHSPPPSPQSTKNKCMLKKMEKPDSVVLDSKDIDTTTQQKHEKTT